MGFNFINTLCLSFDQKCQGSLRYGMKFQFAFIGQLQKRLGGFTMPDDITGDDSRRAKFLNRPRNFAAAALRAGADHSQITGMTGPLKGVT